MAGSPQTHCDVGCAGQVGFRQQQREFFAADSTEDVGVPLATIDGGGDVFENFVANRMTELVIDVLKVVKIHHQ